MNRQILVIDDNEWIRKLLLDLFQENGFQVFEAEDGESACRLLSQHPNQIDLVTLDLELPGIDGVETFHRLRSIQPELKVLIMSGSTKYTGFNPPQVPRLNKPFSTEQVLGWVNGLVG